MTKTFKITGRKLGGGNVKLDAGKVAYRPADPSGACPGVTVSWTANKVTTTLTEGRDYEVNWPAVIKKGTNTILITGKGLYTGTVKKNFTVTAYAVTESNARLTLPSSVVYTKGGAVFGPNDVKVTLGSGAGAVTLVYGTDYTLSYKNNNAVTGTKTPTVTFSFRGNYSGNLSRTFTIGKKPLADVEMLAQDILPGTKSGKYAAAVALTDANGKALKKGTDYTLIYYSGQVTPEEIVRRGLTPLGAKDTLPADVTAVTVVAVAVASDGCCYTGQTYVTYNVKAALVSGAKISLAKGVRKEYTGAEVELTGDELVVKVGKETLTFGVDYTLQNYRSNIAPGTASVTVRGMGKYGGYKVFTFKINTRKMTLAEKLRAVLAGA